MFAEIFWGVVRETILSLRRQGRFDAANEAENFVKIWRAGGKMYEPRSNPEALKEWDDEFARELHVDQPGTRARLKFQPERAWNLEIGDSRVPVKDAEGGISWELRHARGTDPESSRAIILTSSSFPTEAAARFALRRLECALMVASIRIGYGFSFRDRLAPTVITKHGLKAIVPDGIRAIQDSVGEFVFESPPPTIFVHASRPIMSVSVKSARFLDELTTALETATPVEEPVRTAYDLFASSRFENSSRARFLLLVMAVEATLSRQARPQEQIDLLEALLAEAKARAAADPNWEALASGIHELKKESIGTAAARQIAASVSVEAAAEFKIMYQLRSRLVHGGKPVAPRELNDASNKLEPTVKALLLSRLTASGSHHAS